MNSIIKFRFFYSSLAHTNYISHCRFFPSPFYHVIGYICIILPWTFLCASFIRRVWACAFKHRNDALTLSSCCCILDILQVFLRRSSQYSINTGDSYYPFSQRAHIFYTYIHARLWSAVESKENARQQQQLHTHTHIWIFHSTGTSQ